MSTAKQRAFAQQPLWIAATGLPANVYAGQTLAIVDAAAAQLAPYLQFNLALHVGDQPQAVQARRMQFLAALAPYGGKSLHWLNQTHSTEVLSVDQPLSTQLYAADGLLTQQKGQVLMIMTADCLPIVLCNAAGDEVACLHAGWRGLAAGIIEAGIDKMHSAASHAWIGAAISQAHFEVGDEVRACFVALDADFADDFKPLAAGKYLADLVSIASKKLARSGVQHISGGHRCSYAEPEFYSYRQQSITGRMASFVFIAEDS